MIIKPKASKRPIPIMIPANGSGKRNNREYDFVTYSPLDPASKSLSPFKRVNYLKLFISY